MSFHQRATGTANCAIPSPDERVFPSIETDIGSWHSGHHVLTVPVPSINATTPSASQMQLPNQVRPTASTENGVGMAEKGLAIQIKRARRQHERIFIGEALERPFDGSVIRARRLGDLRRHRCPPLVHEEALHLEANRAFECGYGVHRAAHYPLDRARHAALNRAGRIAPEAMMPSLIQTT